MSHLHRSRDDDEDIYGGFNDYNATLDTVVSVISITKYVGVLELNSVAVAVRCLWFLVSMAYVL